MLEIILEKGIGAVSDALRKLEKISPMDMSADKVRVICEHTQEKDRTTESHADYLTEKTRSTLSAYDRLAALQSSRFKKEAV